LAEPNDQNRPDWKLQLSQSLPLFGHRNWIVVADSAYPAQSSPGIETVLAAANQIEAVQAVADAIAASTHIKALVHLDRELAFVEEADAPGVDEYCRQLETALHGVQVSRTPHEEIIARLDHSARVFRILIVKTSMTIPYTSVFFELDCRYWNAGAEQRLRHAMQT
jgi:L-fucose mutarotase/ribose pyranase (RbsD/FucU family)